MLNDKLLYKVIIYVLLGCISYITFRYLINFSPLHAINAAMILTIFVLTVDIIYDMYNKKYCKNKDGLLDQLSDGQKKSTCTNCVSGEEKNGVEGFDPNSTKKCRIVCDGDNEKIEKFDDKNVPTPPRSEIKIDENRLNERPLTSATDVEKVTLDDGRITTKDDQCWRKSVEHEEKTTGKCSWISEYDRLDLRKENQFGFWDRFHQDRPSYDAIVENPEEELKEAREREAREKTSIINEKEQNLQRGKTLDGYDCPYQDTGRLSKLNYIEKGRRISKDLDDELPYSDYNHLPVASGYRSHAYEYGYSFLPPEKWYPQPPRPPICVTEKRCPVMPMFANGAPADVKEFHSSRKILPPDLINTEYIKDHLNDGY